MRTSPVSKMDLALTAGSALIAKILEERESSPLQKRRADRFGSHASAIVPRDERSLVNREIPVDGNERQISEMQNEVASLQVLLQTGGSDVDRNAVQAKITALKLQLSIRTAPAQFTDRIGRIG
jgi:hypothetical protein